MLNRGALFIIAILIVLMVLLQISLWHGESSIPGSIVLKHQIQKITVENDKLMARNQKVYADIQSLRSNSEATEARAREELGLVKPGEIFYRISSRNTKEENK